ncbi:PAS domain-containing protein [Streptomyces sp. NPDC018031]|uniref:PAS domain-containing protein n=1 Tax=Streptomyces sp. NPDC018031 TaxID=3365033 RepID=UPI0037AD945C
MSSRPSRGAARLAAILDALPDALLLVNCNGTVVNANHIALETFETPGTALVGRGLLDLLPSFDSKRIPGSMRRPDDREGGRTRPTRMMARRTDGVQFPVEVTSANLEDGRTPYADHHSYTGDELLMLVVRDLTGTLDTEAELARQQRQTEMILRAAAEGVVGVDTEGKVVLVNPAAAQILGFRASDLGGRELHPLVHHSRPDGTPFPYEETPLADSLRSGRKHRVRGQALWAKDGSQVPVDMTTAPVRDGDQLVGAVMTFTDRRPYDEMVAEQNKRYDAMLAEQTERYQALEAEQTERYDSMLAEQTARYDAMVAEQTERYRALEDRLARERQSLAARNAQLLAVLGESLRGPLLQLRGELGTLAADPAGQLWPEANQILHHLAAGYARMTTLVDNVLSFQRLDAGGEPLAPRQVSLDAVVAAGVEGAVELIGPGRAQFAVHAPPIRAEVDPERLAQALAHLIADVAGVDSTGHAAGGATGDSTIVVAAAQRGEVVRIEVRGPYPGGDPVHGPIVHGVVRRHGGVLQTHQLPGTGGTAFVLEVPLTAPAAAPDGDAAGEAAGLAGAPAAHGTDPAGTSGGAAGAAPGDTADAAADRDADGASGAAGGTGAPAAPSAGADATGQVDTAAGPGTAPAGGVPSGRRARRAGTDGAGVPTGGTAGGPGGAVPGGPVDDTAGGVPGEGPATDGSGVPAPGGPVAGPDGTDGAGTPVVPPPTGRRRARRDPAEEQQPPAAAPAPAVDLRRAADRPSGPAAADGGALPAPGAAPGGGYPAPTGRRARRSHAGPADAPGVAGVPEGGAPAAAGRAAFALPPAAADAGRGPGHGELPGPQAAEAGPDEATATGTPAAGTGAAGTASPALALPAQAGPAEPPAAPGTGRRRARRALPEAPGQGPDGQSRPQPAAEPAAARAPFALPPAAADRAPHGGHPAELGPAGPVPAQGLPGAAGPQPQDGWADGPGGPFPGPRTHRAPRPAGRPDDGGQEWAATGQDDWALAEPDAGGDPATQAPGRPAGAPAAGGGPRPGLPAGAHQPAPEPAAAPRQGPSAARPAAVQTGRRRAPQPEPGGAAAPGADPRSAAVPARTGAPGESALPALPAARSAMDDLGYDPAQPHPQAPPPLPGLTPADEPTGRRRARRALAADGSRPLPEPVDGPGGFGTPGPHAPGAHPSAPAGGPRPEELGGPGGDGPATPAHGVAGPVGPTGPAGQGGTPGLPRQSAPPAAQAADADASHGRAISVRTLGQGVPFTQQPGEQQGQPAPAAGSGRRRKLAARPEPAEGGAPSGELEPAGRRRAQPQPGTPHPQLPGPSTSVPGRAFAIGAPDEGAEGPEPLDGPNGAVEVVDDRTPPQDDELPPEPLDNPRRLLVWPAPDISTQQALSDRGYRPVIVNSREEVDAQIAAYPAALFVDPLTGPITRTALQSLRNAAVAAEVPVLVTAGLGQATREAAYGADPAVLLRALAPRDSEQHPARVLLIEEQEAIAAALTATLERRGMQVARAGADADAVALATQMRPNLVVMDLMQVRRRRAGIVDWLRGNGLLNRTPLVVYTSAGIDPGQLSRLASGETVLFLAERSTSAEVQSRIVDLLAKIGTN